MSHISPAAYLVWSLLSTLLGAFLLGHLWRFDRFRCLRWSNNGPNAGAFKRVMTFSYLLSVPLIMAYSYGFAIIKYQEGYIPTPGGGYFPTPYTLWSKSYQTAILPLLLVFSLAWALEMVTHLEELCFWYFLLNAGPKQPDWFGSLYFKGWAGGSVIALVYMPLVTLLSSRGHGLMGSGIGKGDLLKAEAYTFLAGSIGSMILTLVFLPILFAFPKFLRNIKKEGVDMQVMVRLTKFYEFNCIRIVFRFLMVVPLFTLAVDGARPHTHTVNESVFWTDLLASVAAFGCVISSVMTILIFFPRSFEAEILARDGDGGVGGSHEMSAYEDNTNNTRTATNMTAKNSNQATLVDRTGGVQATIDDSEFQKSASTLTGFPPPPSGLASQPPTTQPLSFVQVEAEAIEMQHRNDIQDQHDYQFQPPQPHYRRHHVHPPSSIPVTVSERDSMSRDMWLLTSSPTKMSMDVSSAAGLGLTGLVGGAVTRSPFGDEAEYKPEAEGEEEEDVHTALPSLGKYQNAVGSRRIRDGSNRDSEYSYHDSYRDSKSSTSTNNNPYAYAPDLETGHQPRSYHHGPQVLYTTPSLRSSVASSFSPGLGLNLGTQDVAARSTDGLILTRTNLKLHNMVTSGVHPLVHTFTSPIDLFERPTSSTRPRQEPVLQHKLTRVKGPRHLPHRRV